MSISQLLSRRMNTLTRHARNRVLLQGEHTVKTQPRFMSSAAHGLADQIKWGVIAILMGCPLVYWGFHNANLAIDSIENKNGATMLQNTATDDIVLKYRAAMAAKDEEEDDDDEE